MKKVFTLLTLALLSISSAWGQTTIGLAQTVTDDGDTHTVGSATYTGVTNVTVAKSIGSTCNDGQTGKTVKVGSPSVSYSATEAFRKTEKTTAFSDNQYVGYTMTVASGYKVSLSSLNAEFWSSDATMYWKVVVTNSSGTALYTSSTVQNNSDSKGTIAVASPTGLANLTAGTYTIKLMMYQNGGNKYFVVPSLTFSAAVEEDTTPTYTITSSAGEGGTVSPNGDTDVIEGGNLSVTATANPGYAFASWTVDGTENASTDNPYTFSSITANHTIAAVFDAMYSISFNVASENKGTSTVGPVTQYANIENKWTAPQNYYTAKEGYTLTAWNDGENNYVPGTEYTLAGNITVAPVYTANTVTVADFTTETTVSWPLSTDGGAPSLASEGNTQYYVQRATIAGNTVDIPIFVDTQKGAGISEKKGKFVNSATNCQVNAGTVFKIPASKNMVVKYIFSQTTAVDNVGFTDDTANLGGDGTALTKPTVISSDKKTITYTYTGTADYLYMVDIAGGKYPTSITVTYPEKASKCSTPTITVGDFSFANKAYPVTITSSEETLQVSINDAAYEVQTSPYVTYVTTTTNIKAKATGGGLEDSDVAEETVTNTFAPAKPYVAWVYTKGYGSASYAFATDPMVTALQADYNVVEVNYSADTTPSTDLNNADLIVCTEAMTGNKTMSNGMKAFAGVTPMIGLKAFNYTKGRWSWGTPANPSPTANAFTPKSAYYKVLDGVTFESDGTIKLATTASGNVIQTVEFGTTDCTAPTGNAILGTIDGNDAKAVMYLSNKFFGLGLSSDCWSTYTENATTIIKNAAAMLISGEALDTKVMKVTSAGYATVVTEENTDFDAMGITAYKATVSADKSSIDLATVTEAPANTPLVIKAAEGLYEIKAAASTPAAIGDNDLMAGPLTDSDGTNYYVLGQEGAKVGFGLLASGVVLPATKAYIPASKFSDGARNFYAFTESETTGIDTVDAQLTIGNSVYNLNGQRIAQPTKGLYIVNGRKVVVK